MKIAVAGLWHLGIVTATCIANNINQVIGYDADLNVIETLKQGILPIQEPGLSVLMDEKTKTGCLKFTALLSDLADADIIWITYDTPVDNNDRADTAFVMDKIKTLFSYLKNNSVLLISSQLPVGSMDILEKQYHLQYPEKTVFFACSPENLRLGQAVRIFMEPDRVIVGISDERAKPIIQNLFNEIQANIIWMKIASAEMTKHAINAFLATSVVFANEIATLCEKVGADAHEVEKGLKSESRIGPRAYLKPGNAFAGGTLARDVNFLVNLSVKNNFKTQIFPAVLKSNKAHKKWVIQKVTSIFPSLAGKRVCVLGLTYKPETDTLRRSSAIEICTWLYRQGAKVIAYDPMLTSLPEPYHHYIDLKSNMNNLFSEIDAVILTKSHSEFEKISSKIFSTNDKPLSFFDEAGFLKNIFSADDQGVQYFCLGRSA